MARLTIGYPAAPAYVLGAFQRRSDAESTLPLRRRVSGGGGVRVGPETLWLQLALDLGDLPPAKLLNQHVRPLLKALTRVTSVPATYFGRDWIAMAKRPIAFVGFAHSAEQRTGVLEAVIFVGAEPDERPSFRGRPPGSLAHFKAVDGEGLVAAIAAAYEVEAIREVPSFADPPDDPPWAASVDEAIGKVSAGRDASGRMRIGGEFMASSDAVARLEDALANGADVARSIDEAFTTGGATIFGVRQLASLRDVVIAASDA